LAPGVGVGNVLPFGAGKCLPLPVLLVDVMREHVAATPGGIAFPPAVERRGVRGAAAVVAAAVAGPGAKAAPAAPTLPLPTLLLGDGGGGSDAAAAALAVVCDSCSPDPAACGIFLLWRF